jgi:protein-disulfide isomerase
MNGAVSRILIAVLGFGAGAASFALYGNLSGEAGREIVQAARTANDPAVEAYLAQAQAAETEASDARVLARKGALENDPATPIIGNESGDIAIVVFSDYTCIYCKAVHPRLKELIASDGNIKFVLKEFPILLPESVVAAKAALAARAQGQYEAFHDAMMEASGQLTEARIFEIAADQGIDVERLRADMETPEIAAHILANFNLARALRIFGTPTFIVGDRIVTGPSAEIDFPALVAAAREG